MLKQRIILASWISLGAALFLCILAGVLFWRINDDEASYLANAQQMQLSAGQVQSAAIAHLALQRASDETTEVQSSLAVDPVQFATLVQSVGPASGATVQISEALPETLPSQKATPGIPQLYAFGFVVQTTGSFPSLMHALELLQNLPAPSSIEDVNMARAAPSAPGGQASWQMEVRVRLTTTDNISS